MTTRAAAVELVVVLAAVLAGGGCASTPQMATVGSSSPVDRNVDQIVDHDVDVGWLVRQGIGQVELLAAARPVSRVLADDRAPDDLRRRLAIVVAARTFARDRLGLAVGAQYRNVVFLDDAAVVYVASAAPDDALDPVTWRYPVVGALPYRGSFSLAEAESFADDLAARGFDVSVRPVTTYSLLGLAPDPIVSPMLYRRDELDIVETVIHELAHATVFAAGQGAFNEGLATFIGRQGRRAFVHERFGRGSAVAVRSEALDDDDDAWTRAVGALAFDLRVLFAQRGVLARAALLDEKQAIFARHQRHWQDEVAPTLFSVRLRNARLPENNAELASVGIYSLKQHLYADAFDACGRDWRAFLRLLRDVATTASPEVALAALIPPRRREVPLP